MKNILVTGGAGFIGSNFIRYFLEKFSNIQIVNLDLLTYAGSLNNLNDLASTERYHFLQGDICNAELINFVFREYQIDTLVHFAAESHVDRSIQNPEPFVKTNVMGTFVLLEAARKFWLEDMRWNATQCRFHHVSTDEVFGSLNINAPPFTETHPYQPNSPYSASKAGADHLVRAYFHTFQLPVTISHCSNNYGPFQHPEKFIPTIIRKCFLGESIPIYGNGSNIRDWLFVEDHCIGIHAILRQPRVGITYNLGGNNEINNISVAKIICEIMNDLYPGDYQYESLITFVTDRPGHDWRYAIDCNKIYEDLRWQPQVSFIDGIRKTIQFYAQSFFERVPSIKLE